MGQVIWSPSALDDVDSIAEYIARDSVDQASLFVERLIKATDRLREFPLSGRVIPEIKEERCREIGKLGAWHRVETERIGMAAVMAFGESRHA